MLPRLSPGLLVCLLTVVLAACGGGGAKKATPTPSPTATPAASDAAGAALQKYVETTLSKQFVEDCTKADATKDAGKVCAVFKGERGQQRAYQLGDTFAQPNTWAIIANSNGNWNVVQTSAINADNASVPGIPWPLTVNTDVVVTGADPCLNVREGPSLSQKAVDCIANGAKIQLASGPAAGDNIQWWQVAGRSGWVAADYLRYPDAAQ